MTKKKSKSRPAVPPEVKHQLYREAGSKCANPGCPNRLVELHHINEWHIYKTHDAKHMIAICPTCHSHAHHGEMRIDDKTIRSWKKARRNPANTGYLYIEPGPQIRMLMGCIYWSRKDGESAIVFRLSERNLLNFRIIPGNILLVSLILSDPTGNAIVELRENHLIHALREGIKFESRPGRLQISVPLTEEFLPRKMIEKYTAENPPAPLINADRVTLLDLQVVDLGTVQVEGAWIEGDRAVIANGDFVSICKSDFGFVHLRGYGEKRGDKDLSNLPIFLFEGDLNVSMIAAAFKYPNF